MAWAAAINAVVSIGTAAYTKSQQPDAPKPLQPEQAPNADVFRNRRRNGNQPPRGFPTGSLFTGDGTGGGIAKSTLLGQ